MGARMTLWVFPVVLGTLISICRGDEAYSRYYECSNFPGPCIAGVETTIVATAVGPDADLVTWHVTLSLGQYASDVYTLL